MFGIIIDENGNKVEFVHVFDNGKIDSHELKNGERLIKTDWQAANSMLKPMWDGVKWVETATQEEIEQAMPKHIKSDTPSTDERLEALENAMLEMVLGGMV